MVVSIDPATGPVGPGFVINVSSSSAVTPGPGWLWEVILEKNQGSTPFWRFQQQYGATANAQRVQLLDLQDTGGWTPLAEADTTIAVNLRDPGGNIIDEGFTQGIQWDPTTALWQVVQQQPTSSGGLTQEEHDAVLETNQLSLAINSSTTTTMQLSGQQVSIPIGQVLASNLLNALTTEDLTSGSTCLPVRIDLSGGSLYGVILIITSVPDTIVFRTPDLDYAFPDLAVLTVIRGGHTLVRHGIHTSSHTLYPLPGLPFPWLTNIGVPVQPPDYHVNVDWAEGVCGQLVGLKFP